MTDHPLMVLAAFFTGPALRCRDKVTQQSAFRLNRARRADHDGLPCQTNQNELGLNVKHAQFQTEQGPGIGKCYTPLLVSVARRAARRHPSVNHDATAGDFSRFFMTLSAGHHLVSAFQGKAGVDFMVKGGGLPSRFVVT